MADFVSIDVASLDSGHKTRLLAYYQDIMIRNGDYDPSESTAPTGAQVKAAAERYISNGIRDAVFKFEDDIAKSALSSPTKIAE